jgi:hypothetical protein
MKEEKPEIKAEDNLVDWLVLTPVLKAERASLIDSIGEALGIHGNQLLDEVEEMIDYKLAKIRDELASLLMGQIAMVLQ